MRKSQSPVQIATPLTELKPTPITRAVTSREEKLIAQINYLKEKLLLSEMAMDEKDVLIANLLKTNDSNQRFIMSFDKRLKTAQNRDHDLRDKFIKLKDTAQKASKVARMKHEKLASIESELDRHQQEILIANRIQAQLMDLVIKNARPNGSTTTAESILSGGFALPFKRKPNTLQNYVATKRSPLEKVTRTFNNITEKVGIKMEHWLNGRDLFTDIEQKLSQVNRLKKTSHTKQASAETPVTLPTIQWCNVKHHLPLKTGMYYVTDGKKVEIAMFDFKLKQFKRTDSNMPIDFWCAPKRKKS